MAWRGDVQVSRDLITGANKVSTRLLPLPHLRPQSISGASAIVTNEQTDESIEQLS